MTSELLLHRSPTLGLMFACWFCAALPIISGVHGETSHHPATLAVSTPHLFYTCPEGATVKMECVQSGAALHLNDVIKHSWLYTPHSDQHCHQRVGPRNFNVSARAHPGPGVKYGVEKDGRSFWVELQNVTMRDQGRYCCMTLDYQVEHRHGTLQQKPHSHVILHITPRRNGSQVCTVLDAKAPEENRVRIVMENRDSHLSKNPAALVPQQGTVSAVLATAACIMALLSVPFILLLVYKHRQSTQSSRRAHELVRMDSTALGHENPVFMVGSPQTKTRTVSQIMARQTSETGRHLLSEAATPLSPSGDGNVFFPSQDPILEDAELVQV